MSKRLLLVLFLGIGTVVSAQNKNAPALKQAAPPPPVKIDYTMPGAPMPNFVLVSLDTVSKTVKEKNRGISRIWKKEISKTVKTNTFTNHDFDNDANLIVMMFNPTCGHCIEETEILKKNVALFKKTRLVLMANRQMEKYLPDFVKERKTKAFFPTFTVGLDSANFINSVFLYKTLPQINIYSPERKLLKIFNGDVAIDSLKRYIQ
jgi:thiol-disulfide isomerase/thioredoxin